MMAGSLIASSRCCSSTSSCSGTSCRASPSPDPRGLTPDIKSPGRHPATLHIGLVGAGGIARAHLPGWLAARRARSPCTRRRGRRSWSPRHGGTTWSGVASTRCSTQVDVVDICTPTPTHKETRPRRRRRGPARRLREAAGPDRRRRRGDGRGRRPAGVQLHPAHVVRYFPEYAAMRQAVAAGAIGDPGGARVHTARAPARMGALVRRPRALRRHRDGPDDPRPRLRPVARRATSVGVRADRRQRAGHRHRRSSPRTSSPGTTRRRSATAPARGRGPAAGSVRRSRSRAATGCWSTTRRPCPAPHHRHRRAPAGEGIAGRPHRPRALPAPSSASSPPRCSDGGPAPRVSAARRRRGRAHRRGRRRVARSGEPVAVDRIEVPA